jgi:hypothetical protein
MPLVLHVGVGDCVDVTLRNDMDEGDASLHADMLAYDPQTSGLGAGSNPALLAAPGAHAFYTFFASPEIGQTTAMLRDGADLVGHVASGMYGAIVVGPAGASYTDPTTGEDAATTSSWRVDVHPAEGPSYRDFALFFQDGDAGIGTHRMPYNQRVGGTTAINYRHAPGPPVLESDQLATGQMPPPMIEATAGDPVRIHVLAPSSEQSEVFSIEGHTWPQEPGTPGTNRLSATQLGGLNAVTIDLLGGAGGSEHIPGDYVYGNHRAPFAQAGQWGVLRVYPCGPRTPIEALGGGCAPSGGSPWTPPLLGLALVLGLCAVAACARPRPI